MGPAAGAGCEGPPTQSHSGSHMVSQQGPHAGEIFLQGARVHFGDPRDARLAGIAAIYQEPSFFPDLDVAENIFVGRVSTGAGRRVMLQKMVDEANDHY